MHVTRGSTRPLPKKSPCRTPSEKAKHWTCLVACRIHSMRTRGGALKRAYDSGVQADPVHAAEPAVRAQVEVPGDNEHRPDAHEKSAEDDQGVSSAEQERGESSEPAQLAGDSARRDAQERADSAAAPLAAPLAASERLSEPTSELLLPLTAPPRPPPSPSWRASTPSSIKPPKSSERPSEHSGKLPLPLIVPPSMPPSQSWLSSIPSLSCLHSRASCQASYQSSCCCR